MLTRLDISALAVLCMLLSLQVYGQNLVPNPGFDNNTSCPVGLGQIDFAAPWYSPTQGSPDYFHECSGPTVGVPVNWVGYQPAFSGEGYAGCYFKADPEYREYIQVQLTQPLQDEACYTVGFFINLSNEQCGVAQVGAHLSVTAPSHNGTGVLNVVPQIVGDGNFYSDTANWVLITGQFEAEGGEEFITIGNFYNNVNTPLDPTCNLSVHSYYYIDNVFVIENAPTSEIDIDFDYPVEACYEYEIDPGLGDMAYVWEDGSTFPTLTVTQSGTYSLTVYSDCARGIDSIEVTILGSSPVSFDPATATLCEGESLTISLDPNAGDYTWSNGSTSAEYVITTPGTHTVSLDDGCEISTDEIEVEVIIPPDPIDLGSDLTLCLGDDVSFSFDPDLGDFTWQDGSDLPSYTIEDPGIYAVTISNACGMVWDEIEVDYIDIPEVDLGPPVAFLCIGDVLELSFDPALGSFIWNDGSTDPEYFVTVPGSYSVTVANNCGSSTDIVDVVQPEQPVVDLPDTLRLCNNALPYFLSIGQQPIGDVISWSTGASTPGITIANGGRYRVTVTNACYVEEDEVYVDITNGAPSFSFPDSIVLCNDEQFILNAISSDATYAWSNGSSLPAITVTASGIYQVTVNNVCGTKADTAVVETANSNIHPDLGPDVALCPGEKLVLTTDVDSVSFLWNDLSTADSLLVTDPGTYSVTVSNVCAEIADTVLVTFNASPPDVSLPDALALCAGDSILLESNISGVTYAWSDGTGDASLAIVSPGTYSLTVSNSCGVDSDTILITDGGTDPLIELGADIHLCPGEIAVIHPQQQGVETWLWQDGTMTDTFIVSNAGIIALLVTNACGVAYDTLHVIDLPATPMLNLGNDTAICPGEMVSLNITFPGVSIAWSDGSMGPDFITGVPGSYYAVISNACGESADTITINHLPGIPALDLGNDHSLCPGEVFIIDPAIENVDYLWQDGSAESTFTTTQPGTFTLTITNPCGSSVDTLVLVESTDGPQVDLGEDVIGCIGDTVIITSGISGVDYEWQDGSSGSSYEAFASGTFILHVSNSCGSDMDTLIVDLSMAAPSTSLGNDTTLCDGNTLVLTSNAPANTVITWQDGSGDDHFTVTTPGTYALREVNVCGANIDSIEVDLIDAPLPFTLGADTVLCPGDTMVLIAPLTPGELSWQDGSSAALYIVDHAQWYSLEMSNECGSARDTISVTYINETPELDFEPQAVCPGEKIVLDAGQAFPAIYTWNDGSSSPGLLVYAPGDYAVTVTTACFSVAADIFVSAGDDCNAETSVYIPNVFSPNGDGVNDAFEVHFEEDATVTSVTGTIYDRWGNLVFSSQTLPFVWNGEAAGKLVNPGVYVYRFVLRYETNTGYRTETLTEDVTVLR